MTREQLQRLKREVGRYTAPSGRPVVILGADEFDALLGHAERLQGFYTDVLEAGFVEGISEAGLASLARERGLWGEPEVTP